MTRRRGGSPESLAASFGSKWTIPRTTEPGFFGLQRLAGTLPHASATGGAASAEASGIASGLPPAPSSPSSPAGWAPASGAAPAVAIGPPGDGVADELEQATEIRAQIQT